MLPLLGLLPMLQTAQAARPEFQPPEDNPQLPRVLLIGDSISVGYTLPTRALLEGKANVHRIPANGGPTIRGLENIDDWLGDGDWDLIHFNWGLHDLKMDESGEHQVPLAQYEENLEKLVSRLEETGAKLLWASTTPVPAKVDAPPRRSEDVIEYNRVAGKIMKAHDVAVNDLYSFAKPQLEYIQRPNNVHFTERGSAVLGRKVAHEIGRTLNIEAPEPVVLEGAPIQWWRDANFGMFIHWGVYAVPAGVWKGEKIGGIGEWIMNRAKIPVEEYEKLTDEFKPDEWDAQQVVGLAKRAGMKYITITSKHHDGFAMYDSDVSDYNIVDATPFDRDPIAELAEECHRQGIKICFYYSHAQDWHHPDGAGNDWDFDPEEKSFARYFEEKAKPQVREILTKYGDIGLIWFDTPRTINREQSEEITKLVYALQPNCLVCSRVGHGFGDYRVMGDNQIPGGIVPGDWETPATMNDTWGFKTHDHNWKPVDDLVYKLVDIVSKGGNYLLNIGPTAEGTIPQASIDLLEEIGRWMDTNSEAIYECERTPFKRLRWRCTTRPGKLYVHLFDWPDEKRVELPGLNNAVKGAHLLADPYSQPLPVERDEEGAVVSLPQAAVDLIDTVLAVDIEGEADVTPIPLKQAEDGSVTLPAAEATIDGNQARYEQDKDCIGFWTEADEWVYWELRVDNPGRFEVVVTQGMPDYAAGTRYRVSVAGQELSGEGEATGSWEEFKDVKLGTVDISQSGRYTVSVKPIPDNWRPMNLRTLKLQPVD